MTQDVPPEIRKHDKQGEPFALSPAHANFGFTAFGDLGKGKTILSFSETIFCLVAYLGVKTVMT